MYFFIKLTKFTMERMKPMNAPKSPGAKELALIAAIMSIAAGCATDTEECLGKERGKGKEDSMKTLVKACDDAVDEHAGTTNAEISEDPGIAAERFTKASQACQLASVRAAQLFGDLRGERSLKKSGSDKYGSCSNAMKWAKARNAEANADAKRLHRNQL